MTDDQPPATCEGCPATGDEPCTDDCVCGDCHEPDLTDCPYWQFLNNNAARGTCSYGCWSEPACITNEPTDGWPSQRKKTNA